MHKKQKASFSVIFIFENKRFKLFLFSFPSFFDRKG